MPHPVNLKNAKEITKKLEHENHKMEERLKELKTAMEMEKDERGKQGGRFWQKGQTGTLSNYAFEVLSERRTNQNHAMKKRNFQLLKDEPLDLPTNSSVSGVMKHVYTAQQKKKMGKDSKARDTRCGQCEDCLASLTCVQCSENYCAGCFATFHLKGALKNHRSVPLHTAGARQSMTPQPTSLENTRISEVSSGEATSEDIIEQSDQPAPTNASSFVGLKQGTTSSSLLHGAYNEEDSAAVFQEALMKWRRAENSRSNDISQSNNLLMHPASTPPVATLESSTSTIENGGSIPEVKSPSHSLSYAQRLLLKQHRRTALGSPYTPYLSCKSSNTSQESSSGNKNSENENDQLHQSEERVNFQSLLEAVNINFQPPTVTSFTTKTSHTITDLTKFHEDQHPVDEFPPDTFEEAINLQTFRTEVKNRTKTHQGPGLHSKDLRSFRKDTAHDLELLSPEAHRETELQSSQKVPSEKTSFTGIKKKNEQIFRDQNSLSPIGQLESNKTPKLKYGHRKRFLPPTGAIATNTMKGILTKSPSCQLKEVAQREQAISLKSQSSMDGFFLVFVKPNPADSAHNIRPAITVQPKPVKISNKLYSLSPRSWHPDSSRGGIVEDGHPPFPKDNAKTTLLHYTYSGQLEGKPLKLNQDDGSSDKILLPAEAQMVSITRGSGLSCTNDHSPSPSNKPIQKLAKGYSLTTVPRRLILTQRSVSCISASSKSHPKQHRPNSSTGVMESQKKRADDLSADKSTNQVQQLSLLHQRNKSSGWTAGCDLEHQREQIRDFEPWNQMSAETTPDTDSLFCKTEVQAFEGETEITSISPSSRTTCQVTPQSSRPQGSVHKKTGRTSRAVVMDGDDLTRYDDDSVHDKFTQNVEDKETLHCLEWELASENGWITAEGRISRLNLYDMEDSDDTSSSVQVNCCQDYGVSTSVLEDQVLDMDEEHELTSINMEEEEVRAL